MREILRYWKRQVGKTYSTYTQLKTISNEFWRFTANYCLRFPIVLHDSQVFCSTSWTTVHCRPRQCSTHSMRSPSRRTSGYRSSRHSAPLRIRKSLRRRWSQLPHTQFALPPCVNSTPCRKRCCQAMRTWTWVRLTSPRNVVQRFQRTSNSFDCAFERKDSWMAAYCSTLGKWVIYHKLSSIPSNTALSCNGYRWQNHWQLSHWQCTSRWKGGTCRPLFWWDWLGSS